MSTRLAFQLSRPKIQWIHRKILSGAPAMLYRRFGRTELQIPVFSCGGMRYQQSWNDKDKFDPAGDNQKNLEACIRRSVDVGINHIETARGYGTSEEQLGYILP